MIELLNVTKTYRSGLIATEALSQLSLRIGAGEFVSIMGPSGSGKTTLLNIAGLLDDFDDGTYRLGGVDVRALGDDALARLRNERLGFVFQSFNLIPDLDVFDNVELPLRYRGDSAAKRRARVEEVLAELELATRRYSLPAELSGGQQQRVAIARALVTRPSLILADEPTGNLDSAMARQIMSTLEAVNRSGTTLIMVTHAPDLAARAHRRLHMLDGKVIDPMARQPRATPDALTERG